MKILKYLFYRFNQLMIVVGNGDIAQFASIGLMSMMFFLNVITLIGFVHIFTGVHINVNNNSKTISVIEVFGLVIILYFLLLWKEKYLNTLKKYEGESKKDKIKGMIIIINYIIISIGALLFSFYLMIKKNRGEL